MKRRSTIDMAITLRCVNNVMVNFISFKGVVSRKLLGWQRSMTIVKVISEVMY